MEGGRRGKWQIICSGEVNKFGPLAPLSNSKLPEPKCPTRSVTANWKQPAHELRQGSTVSDPGTNPPSQRKPLAIFVTWMWCSHP